MSFQFCQIHNEISAWGCPVCRRKAMQIAGDKAVEIAAAAFRENLKPLPKIRAALKGGNDAT